MRLAGGDRFVDAYDELARGQERKYLPGFFDVTLEAIGEIRHEYRQIAQVDTDATESLFADVLSESSETDVFGAALRGQDALQAVLGAQEWVKLRRKDFSRDSELYLDRLLEIAAHQICAVTASKEMHVIVTAAGLNEVIQAERQVKERIDALTRRVDELQRVGAASREDELNLIDLSICRNDNGRTYWEQLLIPVRRSTTVGEFLDKVWFYIRNEVPAYTYGTRWAISESDKGDHFKVLESSHSKDSPDRRPLRSALTAGRSDLNLEFCSNDDLLG